VHVLLLAQELLNMFDVPQSFIFALINQTKPGHLLKMQKEICVCSIREFYKNFSSLLFLPVLKITQLSLISESYIMYALC